MVPTDVMDEYPTFALYDAVDAHPKVQAWYSDSVNR